MEFLFKWRRGGGDGSSLCVSCCLFSMLFNGTSSLFNKSCRPGANCVGLFSPNFPCCYRLPPVLFRLEMGSTLLQYYPKLSCLPINVATSFPRTRWIRSFFVLFYSLVYMSQFLMSSKNIFVTFSVSFLVLELTHNRSLSVWDCFSAGLVV